MSRSLKWKQAGKSVILLLLFISLLLLFIYLLLFIVVHFNWLHKKNSENHDWYIKYEERKNSQVWVLL